MSDDIHEDYTDTIIPPKPPATTARESWWAQAQPDDFTKRALAEVPRMSATREANFVSGNIIVGYLAQ